MPDASPTDLRDLRAAAPRTADRAASRPVGRVTALVLLGLVMLLWGGNWPVMKVAVQAMPPVSFAASRLVLGSLTLFAVAAAAGQLRLPSRHDLPIVLWVGLLQMAVFLLCVSLALQHVPAGRSAILAYTTPLWVVPLALVWLGETLNRMKVAGLLLGLAGVGVLFNPLALDWGDREMLLGNGLLMLAALAWAVNMVQVRRHRWEGTPLSLGPWQLLVGAVLLVPLALVMEEPGQVAWTGELWACLVYNGPIATALGFWAIVSANRALPAITLSLSTLGTPLVGLVASAWWLGEPLGLANLAGLALIGAGLVLVALADRKR
ncbi:DMT family transporter [Aerophototrophica crusticola]|uniref:DMT family transporter n=1 Tax=Aerophototrophica crusticola TaxID=1709002 RepID=A0A858RAU7_9PROT|nr:DMT family transporter [Rhodospirillaceae bacterium B3]